MRFVFPLSVICLVGCLAVVATATKPEQSSSSSSSSAPKSTPDKAVRAQGRADNSKKPSSSDMNSVYQQHLLGTINSAANNNNDNAVAESGHTKSGLFGLKVLKDRLHSKEDGSKKGRLQTVGSVLGDIIGALVSEVARFFGSVVSDVAREVTAHGFVSMLKQIADLTGLGLGDRSGTGPSHASVPSPVHSQPHMPHFG